MDRPRARHQPADEDRATEVADELARHRWQLRVVSIDTRSRVPLSRLRGAVHRLGAELRFTRAGRPQTNGRVERVQRTLLEECWRPTFAGSLVPKVTALKRDLQA